MSLVSILEQKLIPYANNRMVRSVIGFSAPIPVPINALSRNSCKRRRAQQSPSQQETSSRKLKYSYAITSSSRDKEEKSSGAPEILQANSSEYVKCVPREAAALIEDPAAQYMLRRLKYTPLRTSLPKEIIHTSHVKTKPSSSTTNSPKLVFLHGFDSNLLEYRFMLPLLENANIEAHFLDILGWGLTECPTSPGFTYGPSAKRSHLKAFVDQIVGPGPLIMVGASLGGAIVIDFALNYPESVQSLILLAPQAFTDKRSSPFMQIGGLAGIGAEILRSKWLRQVAVEMSYESQQLRKSRDILRIGGLHCQKQGWKEANVDFIKREGYCISKRVREVKCPTLVMWGKQDRVLPKDNAQRFVQEIENCNLEIIEDCGHSPHIEKASLVTANILNFVGKERLA